ncbi:MAG TPA: hypothetical protein EYQ14_10385 [Gammaproteobacteria bacterium]|nr:hypothetical protein [Gammaproteobacteria bacterium]HIL96248.1 hypothetical protein [Pseudomonadales bacterium]
MKNIYFLLSVTVYFGLSSCTSIETTTVTADFREKEGVFVVGYTENADTRITLEDQLVSDLTKREMVAWPSHLTLGDVINTTPQEIIDKAAEKKALSVIILNRVAADASDSVVKNPERISPKHSTLQAFYSHSRDMQGNTYDAEQEVFVEVNLFILDRGEAKLFWSGTTWTFNADDRPAAIKDISSTIADQLEQVRKRYR